jgi:O-antigen/teichoic acid export membrane protein
MNRSWEYVSGILLRFLDAGAGLSAIIAMTNIASTTFLGRYFLLVAVVTFLATPVGGLSPAIVYCSCQEENSVPDTYTTGVILSFVYACFLSIILFTVLTYVVDFSLTTRIACMFALMMDCVFSTSTCIYDIMEVPHKAKRNDVVRGFIGSILKISFLLLISIDLALVFFASAISTFSVVLTTLILNRKYISIPTYSSTSSIISYSRWSSVGSFIYSLRSRLETFLIKALFGDDILGYYGSAKRLATPSSFVSSAISRVIFVSQSIDSEEDIVATNYVGIFAIGLIGGSMSLGSETLSVVFGPEFGQYWWILVAVSVKFMFDGYQSVIGAELSGDGMPKYGLYGNLITISAFLGLSVPLWHFFGLEGFIFGVVVSSAIELFASLIFYSWESELSFVTLAPAYQILASIIMALVTEYVSSFYTISLLNTIFLISAGCLIYVVLLLIFDHTMRRSIREILSDVYEKS